MNLYGAPTTYKRITPERGSGFILKRIYELTEDPKLPHGAGSYPTKRDVYRVTPWYNRPGWSSLIWSSLIKDGLIESIDGLQKVKLPRSYWHARRDSKVSYRAAGRYVYGIGYTVRYRLTPKGRGVLFDMMDRVNAKGKALNSVGSVAEHDAKKDECPVKTSEWREDDFLLPGETKEEWAERNGVTLLEENEPRKKNETHDILKKEALDCAKLAANYAGENQKLRAEKNNLNECLKKLRGRLAALEIKTNEIKNELYCIQSEIGLMIDWKNN